MTAKSRAVAVRPRFLTDPDYRAAVLAQLERPELVRPSVSTPGAGNSHGEVGR